QGGMPADTLSTAVDKPVAIVYDMDGSVTDELLGMGASDASLCSTNSVFGGPDNFGGDAHFLHALIVLNGNCAQTTAQVADLRYHLVRMIGQVLGLDWSQVNVNIMTRNPAPVAADAGGLPVMHEVDAAGCPACYGTGFDPALPKMDDQAALTRLY